ncbi:MULTISPECIES: ribose 5-phosphate isomerase B [Bremerella]|uniref:ribose 5-phosphate isomerase B n=1 Tax=Bremerella TaxID=2714594 RepID=UPI0031EAAD0A
MKIAIASDHAGYRYKSIIIEHLKSLGHEVVDFGTDSAESCDYPDFIIPAAKAVSAGECERGIVLGGSGNGEAIAANRIHGVRCALTWNIETAQLGRQHNKANMISIGERLTAEGDVLKIVDTWLETEFEGGRHERRIEKIDSLSRDQ